MNRIRAAFLLFLVAMPVAAMASASQAALNGSFITGDLCGSWSDARWQQEFSAMKAAGMQYVVIQAVAISYPGKVTQTYYPSKLPNTRMATAGNGAPYPDVVDACLRNAETAGMKVFMGIDLSDEWWNVYGNDTTWLYGEMNFDNQICDELWSSYKAKYPDTFYGWYWAYEVDNVNWTTSTQQAVLIKAMNMQLDHLTSANERLPFMWCPFMNSRLGTPQGYETFWKNVLAGLHTEAGDIFCPQDGVGAGGLQLNQVASWYAALRASVDTKPGLLMWSDVETFQSYDNDFVSATIDRVASQLKIEQPYVDGYTSWEYTYYDSPYHINPGFQETYLDYLKNDSVETIPPSVPSNFTAVLQPDGDVALSWDPSTDDIGICGYNIYRNGSLISKSQVPIINGDTGTSVVSTKFVDGGLSPNTSYTYQVRAYDFADNVSDSSASKSVTTANFKIVSLGRPYTLSQAPSNTYPDPSRTKLTDGKFASAASYADPAWVGFLATDTLKVIIDLGQSMAVQQFMGEFLLDPQPAVYLPKEVSVSISTDDATFTDVGVLQDSSPADSSSSSIHKYYYMLSSPVNARYVKFSTVPSTAWTFIDEFEVLSNSTSGIMEQPSSVPERFDLFQNYPNPFNPTTMINYQLPMTSRVMLNVYDVLGREVATIVNEKQNAGTYSVRFDGSRFPSGVYFYRLVAGSHVLTKKLVLIK